MFRLLSEGSIMTELDKLLKYVQKTNPTMTKEKLIERLSENYYSAFGLVFTFKNSCKNDE